MDASRRGGEADLEIVWPGSGGPLCDSEDIAMSPLVLSSSSSSIEAGCHGPDLAKASSVCLSPDCSAPRNSGESVQGRGSAAASSPVLAGPSMVLGSDSLLDGSPWEIPIRRDLFSQAGGNLVHPQPELWKLRLLRPSSNSELPLRGSCMP